MQLVNVWKESNRVSQLWEDLLVNYVSPDPLAEKSTSSRCELEPYVPMKIGVGLPADSGEHNETAAPPLLERAGFESLRLIKHALDILAAPTEQEPNPDPGPEISMLGLDFIKVSREPEPQPGSAIDTRRMAYGLKIPLKPLHKRPIHQRLFFCLRQWMTRESNELSLRGEIRDSRVQHHRDLETSKS